MEPFKNVFSLDLVDCIADHLGRHISGFDHEKFHAALLADLELLELKARAQLIADHVHAALPAEHGERIGILRAMLHPEVGAVGDAQSDTLGIRGWGIMPLSMVVGQHGLEDFETSLALLRDMTTRFTSEFAVRYFLLADQAAALEIMGAWVDDPSQDVRRLLSEGTRPRLPWAMQLPQLMADPAPMLPYLEALRDDKEEYVRRSVANHLNDIAKDHPDLVGALAIEWMRGAGRDRERLVRHACRTLIKQGHTAALEAFGLGPPEVDVDAIRIDTDIVQFGEALVFSVDVCSTATEAQSLVVDYLVHFRKANGRLVGKVFKWTKFTLQPGECRTLQRSHPIRPITTRRYYSGEQALSLRINGQDFGRGSFELVVPAAT